MTNDPKKSKTDPAEEAEVVDAMRKAAEAEPRVITPEEQEKLDAEAAKHYVEKFRPHAIDTPIYKPPS